MIEYNKVFVDTAPFIYFLDDDPNFGQKTKAIFTEILKEHKVMVSSVITCEEYLIYPYRTNNIEKENVFFEFINDCGIEIYQTSLEIAKKAAKIRAEYVNFKSMDAIQLATAEHTGCDLFLTNDSQLKQLQNVKCITLDEWII